MSIYRDCSASTWRSDASALAMIVALTALPACGGLQPSSWLEEDEAYVRAVPDESRASVDSPPVTAGRDGPDALTVQVLGPVVAELNGLTLTIVSVLGEIVASPPSERTDSSRRWGPAYAADHDVTYQLDVERAETTFQYELAVDRGDVPDATYPVLWGDFVPSDTGVGGGSFVLDGVVLDQVLDDADVQGQVAVRFDLGAGSVAIGLDLTDLSLEGLEGVITPDLYAFAEDGAGAELCFFAETDLTGDEAEDRLEVYARWQPTGAGRADGTLTGDDLGAPVTFVECWGTSGEAVYWWDSAGLFEAAGDPSACFDTSEATAPSCADVFPS